MQLPEALKGLDLSALERLSERERRIVSLGATALAALAVWLIVSGVVGRMSSLETRIERAKERLAAMDTQIASYEAARDELEALSRRAQPGLPSLAQRVEKHANDRGIGDTVRGIRDRPTPGTDLRFKQTGVEVQIKEASLEGVVQFLAAVEQDSRALLQLGRLHLEGHGDRGERLIDADVQVIRFEREP